MAELIHTFTGGKMNKDLDERLVPNGEYRDALNLEIASSESSQVGTFQNIKGNLELLNKAYDPTTEIFTEWGGSEYITYLSNPICIGAKSDENSDEIYWFIASDTVSVIATYNTKTKLTLPLVVDTQNVLKFSKDYLITGINVLEGMLIWTDNQTEPKKILIKDWVGSTANFLTHSQIYNRNFIESDLTVIKKYPLQPPTITSFSTDRIAPNGNPANLNTNSLTHFGIDSFGDVVAITLEDGPQTMSWLAPVEIFYRIGDVLLFTNSQNDPLDTDSEIRCTIQTIIGVFPNQTGATVLVNSVGTEEEDNPISLTDTNYNVVLEQDTPFFEMRFARFGYRYKYKSNELSAFSPFSNPAFIPGEFDYSPKEGYNLGMVNNVRDLTISNFVPADLPEGVESIDILYKATNNNNVYVVETFKPNDEEWALNEFSIETEIITSVVNANQLLRPYDNVPLKALSQEITANRLVYGNYTQNFNLLTQDQNPLQTIIEVGTEAANLVVFVDGEPVLNDSVTIDNKRVAESVKSIRTYQIGVAYMDAYGRTTPVFTSLESSVKIGKMDAPLSNRLTATLSSAVPYYNQQAQFPYFKYYVKETSQEYYNLCLDRFYDAEDGNVWLSFPSAERNKVDEETFLILKKEHANDAPVLEKARYKVIAIKNEAPQFLKDTRQSKGIMSRADNNSGILFPAGFFPMENINELAVIKSDNTSGSTGFIQTFGEGTASEGNLVMRVKNQENTSEWYPISSIGLQEVIGNDHYTITSSRLFGADMNFTSNGGVAPYSHATATPGLEFEIASIESINKPEFEGRFFVKVNNDTLLQEKITSAGAGATNYVRRTVGFAYYYNGTKRNKPFYTSSSGWLFNDAQGNDSRLFIDRLKTKCASKGKGFTEGRTQNKIVISWTGGYFPFNGGPDSRSIERVYPALYEAITEVGALFRFIDAGGGYGDDPNGTIYRIKSTERKNLRTYTCWQGSSTYKDSLNALSRFTLEIEPIERGLTGLQWDPVDDGGNSVNCTRTINDKFTGIEFLKIDLSDEGFTTNNPAIFETEPKEAAELDIYYEVPGAYAASEQGTTHTLPFFNCYSFGNGVESDRIRDDYNQPTIDNGVKASATLDEPYNEEHRGNGLIFSQIFNSVSGVNGLNQFIQAEAITKDVNPEYGSIQKLHGRDTNLVTLCENKSMKILANKDALFNADGSANVTSNKAVLGQTVTYQGEFGIGTHPESFAEFGFRMYYADANKGTVIRLSNDGITEVSDYGMHAFFSDNLPLNDKIVGTWDTEKKNYNISLSTLSPYWQQTLGVGDFDRTNPDPACGQFLNTKPTTSTTISFKEDVNGWTSRKVYIPEAGVYLNNVYYTFKDGRVWEHGANLLYNTFYNRGPNGNRSSDYYESAFTTIFNEQPSSVKGFKTVNYSGTDSREYIYRVGASLQTYSLAQIQAQQLIPSSFTTTRGWYLNSIITDLQEGEVKEFINKEGKYFNYIKGLNTFFTTDCDNNVDSNEFNVQGIGRASVIVAPDVTSFTVTNKMDPDCFSDIVPPELEKQVFIGVEDTLGNFAIAESNVCTAGITFELISDSTTAGTLVFNSNGTFTFNPDLNYFGGAGAFVVRACCGDVCSGNAEMGISILPVAENPYFTTDVPSLTGLVDGDVWTYNPIGIDDPDHTPSELFIASPTGMPSWMYPPAALNDGSGNWYIPPSTVSGGAGSVDFTMIVVDPDGNQGTQQVVGDTVVGALLDLEFLVTSRPAQVDRDYTDPTTGLVTTMVPMLETIHACNRGTYLIKGNTTEILRAYVGNVNGTTSGNSNLYDTYTLNGDGWANSLTGDVQSGNVISATAQGTTNTVLTQGPYQKYITASDNFLAGSMYNLITITPAIAQQIVDESSGPNPEIVSFGIVADTYSAGGTLNTHGEGVYLQVFKSGVEIYSQKQPNDSAVIINVLTGEIL